MFSSVNEFFYEALAGINHDESAPDFKHILLKPNPMLTRSGLGRGPVQDAQRHSVLQLEKDR
jgi:hypothetical protein